MIITSTMSGTAVMVATVRRLTCVAALGRCGRLVCMRGLPRAAAVPLRLRQALPLPQAAVAPVALAPRALGSRAQAPPRETPPLLPATLPVTMGEAACDAVMPLSLALASLTNIGSRRCGPQAAAAVEELAAAPTTTMARGTGMGD